MALIDDRNEGPPAEGPVLDAEGHFHAIDEPIDLSGYGWEDWLTLVFFGCSRSTSSTSSSRATCSHDSAAWTEEIARYLLIVVCFVGPRWACAATRTSMSSSCITTCRPAVGRVLSTFVDVVRILFLGYATYLSHAAGAEDAEPEDDGGRLSDELRLWLRRVRIRDDDVPRRAGRDRHWQQGWSVLERPGEASRRKDATMNSLLLGGFVALMATGVPIAIAMCIASLLYIWTSGTTPPLTVVHRMVGGVDSFPLLAVPFFIYAGNLMNSAGITNRIYNFALALVGWLKGGLGHVNVLGSVIFAGMSGTAIADAGGLGTIEIKAMQDHGYPTEFAVGITAASATLGPIIPPSLPMVIYGVQANASIGKLFAGGFMPGASWRSFMMAMVGYYRPRPQIRRRHRLLVGAHGAGLFRAGRDRRVSSAVLFYLWSQEQESLGGMVRFGLAADRGDGRRQAIQVRGVHGAADPGDPDRRHGVTGCSRRPRPRSPRWPGRCSWASPGTAR